MNKTIKKAIKTYGVENQLNVAVEEFAELTKEICKHKRGLGDRDAILEEMADCRIMLEQIRMIFDFSDEELSNRITMKIGRLKHRLIDYRTKKGR